MLQSIREHTQGWIAGTIISIIIMSFALWGIHSYFVGGGGPTDVAEVNGIGISKTQFSIAYERLKRQLQGQFGTNNPFAGKESLIKDRALKTLIDQEVLKQASIEQGFQVSDAQLDGFLQTMPEFQVDGQFSMDRLQQVLTRSMLSVGELLDMLRTNLLIDQPKIGIVSTSFSPSDENTYVISLLKQERDFDYLTVSKNYFADKVPSVSPDQIKSYYNSHASEFMTPDQVSVDYIEVTSKDLGDQITVSDDVLQSYYKDNLNSYTLPMQWKVEDIEIPVDSKATIEEINAAKAKADAAYQAILKGEDFAKVAKGYKGSLSSKGWMTLNDIPPELQKSVSTITKPNQLLLPYRTSDGFVIIKSTDVQQPKVQTFEDVKQRIKDNYVHAHAEEKLADMRDRLADLTYEHPDTLAIAAKELKLPIKSTGLFFKDKAGPDIAEHKKVRDVAFSQDVLKGKNNSDVIQINSDAIVVLRVKDYVPAKTQSLNEVSSQIQSNLRLEAAKTQADRFANDLIKKLNTGANPQQTATENKLNWTKAGSVSRLSNEIDPAILDVVFRLPNPSLNQSKTVYGLAKLTDGFAIIKLNTVKAGALSDPKQYSVYAEELQTKDGLLEYELYKRSQIQNAKINLVQ